MTTGSKRALPGLSRGIALLHDPLLNKGTAFTEDERDALGLRGLLPPHVHTQEEQVERLLQQLRQLTDPLDKFVALNALHDRNEALFFRVVCDHIDEMQPIIYTPTVGLACQRFGQIFQRPRGMFISINDRGRIAEVLRNWPLRRRHHRGHRRRAHPRPGRPRRERHGHSGRQAVAVHRLRRHPPAACACRSTLDVGTNNETLLDDPFYVGLRQHRVTGAAYDELIEEFIMAAQEVFPGVLIQFEDFANHNAFRLLEKYRDRICTLQRRHPGHGGGRAGGPVLRAARDRRQARRPDAAVPRRRRGGDRHCRSDGRGDGGARAVAGRARESAAGWSIRAAWW